MIISTWCLQRSSKFSGQEFEEICRNIGSLETLKDADSFKDDDSKCNESVLIIIQQLAADTVLIVTGEINMQLQK